MSDLISVYTADTLIHTGSGQLTGLVITSTGATAGVAILYDNTSAAAPKIFEAEAAPLSPIVIFFEDRFAPRFATGLYIDLDADLHVTLWARLL